MNHAQKMIEYCRRDTEITGKFVQTMELKYEQIGAQLKTTIASSTLQFFESEFHKRVTHSFTNEQIEWFHTGYYGGRTEVFFNKPISGKIFYHDVNALYAHCLKTGLFPKLEGFYETNDIQLQNEGIAEVTIESPESLRIPYLPTKFEGKLIFPIGEWRGTYTYFELRRAIALGYTIAKTHRAIEFPECFNPFASFIETIANERLRAKRSGDELLSQLWKDFGNHAYGKYAQNNESTRIIPTRLLKKCNCKKEPCKKPRHLKQGDTFFGDKAELVFRNEKTSYARYANCVWAMYVTAIARDTLYPMLCEVEKQGGLLLYCDTDSVIYEHKKQIFKESDIMGDLKLERPKDEKGEILGDFYVYAHFKLPKLYCLKAPNKFATYKTKGVPACSQKSLHGSTCQCLSSQFFEKGKVTFKKPNKMRETFRRNLSPSRKYPVVFNYWEERQKEIRGRYTKRVVLKNGETIPIKLKGEEVCQRQI